MTADLNKPKRSTESIHISKFREVTEYKTKTPKNQLYFFFKKSVVFLNASNKQEHEISKCIVYNSIKIKYLEIDISK